MTYIGIGLIGMGIGIMIGWNVAIHILVTQAKDNGKAEELKKALGI